MAKRRLTDADYSFIAEKRESGWSYERIARAVGNISAKAISWHCLRLGADPPKPPPCRLDYHLRVPMMKRGNHVVRAFTPAEDARLLELEKAGSWRHRHRAINRAQGEQRARRLMTLARREERAAS